MKSDVAQSAPRWIYSPRLDLIFISGAAVFTPLFYLFWKASTAVSANEAAGTELAALVFASIFDFPHVVQTLFRTERDEIRKQYPWASCSLIAVVAFTFLFINFVHEKFFFSMFGIFGTWHIVRQSIGLLKLYHYKLSTPPNSNELKLECILLYLFFLVFGPFDLTEWERSGMALAPWFRSLINTGAEAVTILAVTLAALILHRMTKRLQTIDRRSGPKDIFILSMLAQVAFLAYLKVPPIIFVALSTLQHDLQYQIFIARYQKKIAGTKSMLRWLSFSLAWGLLYWILYSCVQYPGLAWVTKILPVFIAVTLWHYIIDGFIWKFSSSPELRLAFELAPRAGNG